MYGERGEAGLTEAACGRLEMICAISALICEIFGNRTDAMAGSKRCAVFSINESHMSCYAGFQLWFRRSDIVKQTTSQPFCPAMEFLQRLDDGIQTGQAQKDNRSGDSDIAK